MIAASFAVALLLFVPEHLTEMSESIIAQPFLYANFLFWNKTGYFAADAESREWVRRRLGTGAETNPARA